MNIALNLEPQHPQDVGGTAGLDLGGGLEPLPVDLPPAMAPAGHGLIPETFAPPPVASARAAGGQAGYSDFQDFSLADPIAAAAAIELPHDHEFNQAVSVDGPSHQRLVLTILLGVVLAVVSYGAYLQFVEEVDPIEHVMSLVARWIDEPPPELPVRPEAAKSDSVAAAPPPASPRLETVPGNPYWHLANRMLGEKPHFDRAWTLGEEEAWRAGLVHRYTHQRWKTVMEVRQSRLRGSEAILWEALHDTKFWTRAYAAVGLAEMGVEISLKDLNRVLESARSELVADFFERFIAHCNPGQCFVLRQVMRLLDEKGRLIALQGIARSKDQLRELYLAAATRDPGQKIKRWITGYLASKPIDPDRYNALMEIVDGKVSEAEMLTSLYGAKGARAGAAAKDKAGTDLGLHSQESMDDDEFVGDDEDGNGGVEFYDYDKAETKPSEDTDAETFEYDE